MSKNVLIISSSPRKGGNSDTLCDEFMRGAKEAGNEVIKVFLKDKNISYCSGCGVCNSTQKCSINDDMAVLLEEMKKSDVIVMATPTYFYTMCGQMKTFIDRCCPAYTQIVNKDFYFIIAAADGRKAALERAMDGFRGFLDCLNDANEKQTIFASGVWNKDDIKNTDYIKEAYEMGKNI